MSIIKGLGLLMTLCMGVVMLVFMVEPSRVIGWGVNPVNKHTTIRYLTALSSNDLQAASTELGREPDRQKEWARQMEGLKAQGFYVTGYDQLKVPFDREHMDGRVNLTFSVNGKEETYYTILTYALNGINQACIFSPDTEFTQAWNRLNCHY